MGDADFTTTDVDFMSQDWDFMTNAEWDAAVVQVFEAEADELNFIARA